MDAGWLRPVHVKSEDSRQLPLLLTDKRTLKRKHVDIENEVRRSRKAFGLLLGARVQRSSFDRRVRELVAHDRLIVDLTECMLSVWLASSAEGKGLHTLLDQFVGHDDLCRCFVAFGFRRTRSCRVREEGVRLRWPMRSEHSSMTY